MIPPTEDPKKRRGWIPNLGSGIAHPNKQEEKYARTARYRVLADIDLDLHSNEARSTLVDLSPVDFEYNSKVPPPHGVLKGRNLDIDIDRSGAPTVKHVQQREHKHTGSGLTYDKNKGKSRNSERGRGRREFTGTRLGRR